MGKASKTKPPRQGQKEGRNAYGHLLQFAESARPHVLQVWHVLLALRAKVAPYATDVEMVSIACGFLVTFFGARFTATIAAAEAFRIVGIDASRKYVTVLADNYTKAAEASAKDDKIDDDADGVADVEQIPLDELVRRKTRVILKSLDPEPLSQALAGLYGGATAVVATLRVSFAKTVTLCAAAARRPLPPRTPRRPTGRWRP